MGTFHHNPLFSTARTWFLAGGSGVALAMSMIRDIVDHDLPRRFHLDLRPREDSDIIFRAELDTLPAVAPCHPSRPRDSRTERRLDRPTGFLYRRHHLGTRPGRWVSGWSTSAGPQALYPFALQQLSALGHPRNRDPV